MDSPILQLDEHGFWLQVGRKAYFIAFADYPVFERATVAEIYTVQSPFPGDFHWPLLDADIELDMLENPEAYPLSARVHAQA